VAQFSTNQAPILMAGSATYLWLNSSAADATLQTVRDETTWLVLAWMFLFGHLVWATGFMFLIS